MTCLLLLLFTGVIETDHYRLHAEGPKEQAQEYARVLEAAYVEFGKFFKAEPKLKKGRKLVVRYFLKREDWAKAILADRAMPPADAGGLYWPGSRTAYLYRQPTRYYTRTLLIHEAAHQFHYLARTKNNKPGAAWYAEGIAEYLAAHYWDGERLKLGVLPHVTLKDYAKDALALAKGARFDLMKHVAGKTETSRPLGWAIVRYAATEGGKGFAGWAKKMDSGGSAAASFKRAFKRKFRKGFVPWLERSQEPFRQIWNEWQGIGERELRGFARVTSACQLKQEATELSARLVPPSEGRWRAGLLLHYVSDDDYRLAYVYAGGALYVNRRVGKGWRTDATVGGLAREDDGSYRLRVHRKDGRLFVEVGGKPVWEGEAEGGRFGLAVDGCDARFHEVRWK